MSQRARGDKEKEAMRATILEAATKIIIDEGIEGLSMRKIAGLIEYTPTTIYNHYKNKQQIVADIAGEIYNKAHAGMKTAFQANASAPVDRKLELGFKLFIIAITSNPEMGKMAMGSGCSEDIINLLQEILQQGKKEGSLRRLDDNMAWMLLAALTGFAMEAIKSQTHQNSSWRGMVNSYVEMLVSGLRA
ncbi:MAG: TetR/AcrR family transcriptional regulator [Defluviitaleaceae bacterium]|nr:TetR/AcrR family transcriptional regulator [Defluviitaleaceae bacterium]